MTEAQRIIAFPLLLRKETETAHTALETLPISKQLMSLSLNLEQYCEYLTMMYSVVLHAEQFIYPLLAHLIPDIDERRKAPLISRDLGHLKQVPPAPPANVFAERSFSEPFALGIMYVMEGSSLGGRVILKNVQKQIAVTESEGGRYFAGYGDSTGLKWKNFIAVLSDYEERTQSGAEIINGANFAFMMIREHLNKSTIV